MGKRRKGLKVSTCTREAETSAKSGIDTVRNRRRGPVAFSSSSAGSGVLSSTAGSGREVRATLSAAWRTDKVLVALPWLALGSQSERMTLGEGKGEAKREGAKAGPLGPVDWIGEDGEEREEALLA